jgi:hypothetical protein
MQDLPDDVERDVLGEHLSHKLDVLTEGMTSLLKDVPEIKTTVGSIDDRLTRVENKLDVVGDAVKEHIGDKTLHN